MARLFSPLLKRLHPLRRLLRALPQLASHLLVRPARRGAGSADTSRPWRRGTHVG